MGVGHGRQLAQRGHRLPEGPGLVGVVDDGGQRAVVVAGHQQHRHPGQLPQPGVHFFGRRSGRPAAGAGPGAGAAGGLRLRRHAGPHHRQPRRGPALPGVGGRAAPVGGHARHPCGGDLGTGASGPGRVEPPARGDSPGGKPRHRVRCRFRRRPVLRAAGPARPGTGRAERRRPARPRVHRRAQAGRSRLPLSQGRTRDRGHRGGRRAERTRVPGWRSR